MTLRPDADIQPEAVAQLLLSLKALEGPCSFELVGTGDKIRTRLVCRTADAAVLSAQCRAHLRDTAVEHDEGIPIRQSTDLSWAIVDFGLEHEFMLPLTAVESFNVDPLSALCGAMELIAPGETALFQVLFQETREPWAQEALSAVGDGEGGCFFIDAPEFKTLAEDKLARPLFAAVIRAAASARNEERAWDIVRAIGSALGFSANPAGNALVPLSNDDYPDEAHLADIVTRQSRRSGMLLNVDELVSFVHPPSSSVQSERLERLRKKTRPAPATSLGHSLVLGTNTHAGKSVIVSVNDSQRLRHTYVIGASGTGKSTLLLNMLTQDIAAGRGCALLDPHGDLVDQVLDRIPEARVDDIVLLDAGDDAYPVAFNVLQAHSELEKNLLSSDLVEAFKRLSTTWGDQMTSVLGNAILAVLESPRGGTIADLRRFLVEPEFREEYLQSVQDPEVIYYWRKEFPMLTGRPQAPLLTRLDTFLRPKLIRAMVGQKFDRLDFRAIMDGRKIFLAKLTQGAIGEENAYLLGTLLVTKLHQAALGRQNLTESDRIPFFLYLDEFQHFITPSLASILSGARKFGLGLILSHQELRQVANEDTGVAGAVIANPFTRICFRVGDDDAKRLRSGFASFDEKDLQSLGVGEAIVRLERAENDFTLSTPPLPPKPADAALRRERIVQLSRERYARRRADVEADLSAAREPVPPKNHGQPKKYGPPKH